MTPDPRVDAYIARAAPFAQPILTHLRAIVRAAAPEAEETIKWSSPAYVHKGKLLCGFSAFKAYAAFGFWRGAEVTGGEVKDAAGSFGKLASLADLPDDATLAALIERAKALIDTGGTTPRARKHPQPPVELPDDLAAALEAVPAARATYEGFAPSHRRDYVEWVTGAKRPETRARRVAQAVAQMAAGKRQNWKYAAC